MAYQVLLYISAAQDLAREREILGRAVTEIPVSLGWRIVQSPGGDEPVDLDAVSRAHLHLLLLASDIRAPVGLEWLAARRAGRQPTLLLKQAVLRTPAAHEFVRYVGGQARWQPFKDGPDLRVQVLRLLAGHILEQAGYYALSPLELSRLQAWQPEVDVSASPAGRETAVGTGESGVVLSPERYVPTDGVLIRPDEEGSA